MVSFVIRFFISNLFICVLIGLTAAAKQIFKNYLSGRMQYNLWFIVLVLLAIPLLPAGFPGPIRPVLSTVHRMEGATELSSPAPVVSSSDWMNDFSISVSSKTPSLLGVLLLAAWTAGMLTMAILAVRSAAGLYRLKQSSLPLQNNRVREVYRKCLREAGVTANIPVYSTAYLKSPVMAGFFHPRIYIPIHLISDCEESELRFMMLHELQHYRYKDGLINGMMNLAAIVYWFNPFVWYALREMRSDREVACDTAVLQLLREPDYQAYGNTLINFAEKISLGSFPFATGIGGSMKQIRRRILNIAAYEKPSVSRNMGGLWAFGVTALLLVEFIPVLAIYGYEEDSYRWDGGNGNVIYEDFSSYFGGIDGSFVMYVPGSNTWRLYQPEYAAMRVSPNSTFKIYGALMGLDSGVIAPGETEMSWDGKSYPFDAWNSDQDLQSAMQNSVNWYFQSLDSQMGAWTVSEYLRKIGYGNQDISGGISSYWLESSLKISAIEQVELLYRLYENEFGFSPENIQVVKQAIRLSSSEIGVLYGKTGTGKVDGLEMNGWFVGYVETAGEELFFASNIQGDGANGMRAAEIGKEILRDIGAY